MSWFKNDKKGKPPHTWYPDILHWREGDKISCWNISRAIGYLKVKSVDLSKYLGRNESGYIAATFIYKSVDETGNIFLEDEDGHLIQFEFWRFIKSARNETLKSRNLEGKLKNSQEYMELMHTFQQAFDELQESDNHPKRLGEPNRSSE